MIRGGVETTMPSHVIRNVQEKTEDAQRRRMFIHHSQAKVLPLLDISIQEVVGKIPMATWCIVMCRNFGVTA